MNKYLIIMYSMWENLPLILKYKYWYEEVYTWVKHVYLPYKMYGQWIDADDMKQYRSYHHIKCCPCFVRDLGKVDRELMEMPP